LHGSEGGEEAVAGVKYVAEEHFFFVKWTFDLFGTGYPWRGGAGKGVGEGWYGPRRG